MVLSYILLFLQRSCVINFMVTTLLINISTLLKLVNNFSTKCISTLVSF